MSWYCWRLDGNLGRHPCDGDRLQERGSSRVVVERYDRLELRTKDSNVTVVELSLFNYGGGPGKRRPGPCIARKVQEESGPE